MAPEHLDAKVTAENNQNAQGARVRNLAAAPRKVWTARTRQDASTEDGLALAPEE
jgi:hypothetical protein